jgi:glycosidase
MPVPASMKVDEFHIARSIRQRYQLDEALFQTNGHVILADFRAARAFAHQINTQPDPKLFPEYVKPGEIYAVGLIDEIFHYVIGLYQKQKNPRFFSGLLQELNEQFTPPGVDEMLLGFIDEFPPTGVYQKRLGAREYLQSGSSAREAALEELLIIWMANQNKAYLPLNALFNDAPLQTLKRYPQIIQAIQIYSQAQPGFGPRNAGLVDLLRSPALAVPDSIQGQLEYIRSEWGYLLGEFLLRILGSLDFLKEETKLAFMGPGPVEIPLYDHLKSGLLDEVHYSLDSDWMPNLVMIARNTYVWLHQLSVQYQRDIRTLADIPDEELRTLAQRGINGLWLIGLWERSRASARIKQLMGNPEAISSAYALCDYRIADDLGGETAYENFNQRARRFGIRLASDMVPNHMAIDSNWVMEHPDWFISQPYSPFPGYRFSGPDLSANPGVSVQIEDQYYSRSDAAVVFKRYDHGHGSEQFIYHGNDGTGLPWNDTAQLNYLKPEVREAVIQTILQVARRFPIIRFDAAMTLTRKHFHRLWFPSPGSGGDIPSRAEHAMSDEQFDQAMPHEFWREVVDRMAVEAPDTLLLAEAFWLMESYFVRTLGMHRVYNSAFMHLLRDQENAKYRALIKNTLEFDPNILKRFVNFLNNPDERTAIDQFGKGDKYFGACTLMVTLPGLPMFGHGQIEGYTEKYGMEYRRAYYDEKPDEQLVRRHEQQIFPLLKKRYLFADVENFLLYDFFTPQGQVDENVYVYSNRAGHECGLALYNNRYESTRGWVRLSAAFADKGGADSKLIQRPLHEGLALQDEPNTYTLFFDQANGLTYIRRNADIIRDGMYFELNGYQAHVFINFRQVQDHDGVWERLHAHLNGRGAADIDDAYVEVRLRPALEPLRQIFNKGYFDALLAVSQREGGLAQSAALMDDTRRKLTAAAQGLAEWLGRTAHPDMIEQCMNRITAAVQVLNLKDHLPAPAAKSLSDTLKVLETLFPAGDPLNRTLLLAAILLEETGRMADPQGAKEELDDWLSELRINRLLDGFLRDMGVYDPARREEAVLWTRRLAAHPAFPPQMRGGVIRDWAKDALTQPLGARLMRVNRYEDIDYFSKEEFELLCAWLEAAALLVSLADPAQSWSARLEYVLSVRKTADTLVKAAKQSGYQLKKFFSKLDKSPE